MGSKREKGANRLVCNVADIRKRLLGLTILRSAPAAFIHHGDFGELLGYVPLAEVGAECLFQVVAERAEKAAVVLTTNLPFSEWTQAIPNARLCKALFDRIADRAHILETGAESYRFRRTAAKQKKGVKP